MSKQVRLYRVDRVMRGEYVWLNRKLAYVVENRQLGWVLVQTEGTEKLVAVRDLRQCNCDLAGQHHYHAK